MKRSLLIMLGILLACTAMYASPGNDTLPQPAKSPQSPTSGTPSSAAPSSSPGTQSATAPNLPTASSFDPVVATQHYIDQLPAASKASSDAYFEGGYWLILWNFVYGAILTWIFMFGGLSQWMKKISSRFRSVNMQNWVYALLFLLFSALLSFPLDVYQGFIREHAYHLSNQTFLQWLGDGLKGLGVSLVLGGVGLMILYWALRKTGKRWWVWGAGLVIFFLAFLQLIYPVFISPLFNQYTPLQEGPIKESILSMARANQVPANNVYQFNASLQSTRISANVSGLMGTTRVSLNDNLLKRCTPQEIKSVMGHELGHYVLNHIYKLILEMGLVIFFAFAFIKVVFERLQRRYAARWKITGISDIAAFPVIYFIFSLYFFLMTPVTNSIIRTQEVEADHFGLNAAREPDAFAAVAMKLSEYRKIDPGYWEEIIFFDHPSGRHRVYSAMVWKAEELKQQQP